MAEYANIIVDIFNEKLDKTFQYRIPEAMKEKLTLGMQVYVPFGKRNIKGYVVELTDEPEFEVAKIKEIIGIVTDSVPIESQLIALAGWMKKNYGATMNHALKTVIPIKKKSNAVEHKSVRLKLTEIEAKSELAEFVGKDEALCFSTGFTVNEGVIPQLAGRGDYIICDDRDHASIVDGRRLSFATQLKYKHNDMDALEKELQKCEPDAIKLIVVDSVFSMEGDLANLPEIVRLKKKYNASIYVDEAHGLGVFGRQGRGVCDHFGVTEDIDLIMGTFSKSLASIGGFVAGDKDVINWLRHNARSYIFQASNTPAATAAAREAIHIFKTEPERQQRLWEITNYSLKRFRESGFEIGETESPIIPLYVRDTDKTFEVTKLAFDEGVFINPVIPPACAPQDTLVRFALMATHTKEQVDFAIEKLIKCFKQLDILK